jgi:hypothetical protein
MTIPEQADIVERIRKTARYLESQLAPLNARYCDEAANEIERLRSLVGVERAAPPLRAREEKLAPVQGYSAGIPWSMHLPLRRAGMAGH